MGRRTGTARFAGRRRQGSGVVDLNVPGGDWGGSRMELGQRRRVRQGVGSTAASRGARVRGEKRTASAVSGVEPAFERIADHIMLEEELPTCSVFDNLTTLKIIGGWCLIDFNVNPWSKLRDESNEGSEWCQLGEGTCRILCEGIKWSNIAERKRVRQEEDKERSILENKLKKRQEW
ncbi:hypothetical protein EJB05_48260, partial [Eragrostis curvula]